jgi:hypothetical protein
MKLGFPIILLASTALAADPPTLRLPDGVRLLEGIRLCAAQKAAQSADIAAYFAGQ